MRNIKLTIEYDGTNYHGWQGQPQGHTIQETIQEALNTITGDDITLSASGRTDSGVHALAQVANFKTNSKMTLPEFQKGLNSSLPWDIAILKSEEVSLDFHAQYSAKSKIYVYKILNREYRSALLRNRTWYMPYELDLDLMIEAGKMIVGEHDFKAFAQTGTDVRTTVRNVINASINSSGDISEFQIEAKGFLKRMVRLLTGTLVQVGKKRITPEEFQEILLSGEKTKFVYSAPPEGLYLKEVIY